MIVISEWMPNPAGKDAAGEWVELHNSGETSVDITGWHISTSDKPGHKLSGTIPPDGYFMLPRAETKLSLKNQDGELFLRDITGTTIDHAAFLSVAPEGKSMNRADNNLYFFADPTPGAVNQFAATGQFVELPTRAFGTLVRRTEQGFLVPLVAGIAVGAMLTAILIVMIKRDHGLSELFIRAH